MKKLITAVLLGSVLLVNSAFANKKDNTTKSENVSFRVENSFKQEFTQASDVSWEKSNNYYRVAFKMNEEVLTAYYTPDGEFLGVIHNMLSTQLPVSLQVSLKKEYDGYWITELFEMAKKDGNSYFVTLHNADQVVTLESTDGYTWSVYNKVKK